MEEKAYCTRICGDFYSKACHVLDPRGKGEAQQPGEKCRHPEELKKQRIDPKLGLLEQNLVHVNSY